MKHIIIKVLFGVAALAAGFGAVKYGEHLKSKSQSKWKRTSTTNEETALTTVDTMDTAPTVTSTPVVTVEPINVETDVVDTSSSLVGFDEEFDVSVEDDEGYEEPEPVAKKKPAKEKSNLTEGEKAAVSFVEGLLKSPSRERLCLICEKSFSGYGWEKRGGECKEAYGINGPYHSKRCCLEDYQE